MQLKRLVINRRQAGNILNLFAASDSVLYRVSVCQLENSRESHVQRCVIFREISTRTLELDGKALVLNFDGNVARLLHWVKLSACCSCVPSKFR